MWRLGFFFHEMGYGLLSIFLPLYIMSIESQHGLFYIGILTAVALLLAIPASFLWGYLCDKTRRYTRYILLSFLGSTVILYLFTLTSSVTVLIILYAVLSVLHVAHEAPKNVLIAESYSHEEWEKSFAYYEGFTEIGGLVGILMGFVLSVFGVGAVYTLVVCSVLNLAALVLSWLLVRDPVLIFERSLVKVERSLDFSFRGMSLASRLLDGFQVKERLRKENVGLFCGGLILFSLATSILFTPMAVFVSKTVQSAGLSEGVVFAIFVINSGGGVAGYFFAGRRASGQSGHSNLGRIVLLRILLTCLLVVALFLAGNAVTLVAGVLFVMGLAYALFLVSTLSLSMELIPAGRAGLFNVLIGVGSAVGSFVGPFLAYAFGFLYVFSCSIVVFVCAFVAFRLFA